LLPVEPGEYSSDAKTQSSAPQESSAQYRSCLLANTVICSQTESPAAQAQLSAAVVGSQMTYSLITKHNRLLKNVVVCSAVPSQTQSSVHKHSRLFTNTVVCCTNKIACLKLSAHKHRLLFTNGVVCLETQLSAYKPQVVGSLIPSSASHKYNFLLTNTVIAHTFSGCAHKHSRLSLINTIILLKKYSHLQFVCSQTDMKLSLSPPASFKIKNDIEKFSVRKFLNYLHLKEI
jgi:hypothetical protein